MSVAFSDPSSGTNGLPFRPLGGPFEVPRQLGGNASAFDAEAADDFGCMGALTIPSSGSWSRSSR